MPIWNQRRLCPELRLEQPMSFNQTQLPGPWRAVDVRKSSSSGRDAGRGWANHRGEKIPLGCLSGPADMSPTPNATAERNGRWLDELPARVARMSVRETRWSRAKSLWPLGLGLLGMMTPKKVPCYQYYCQYWHPHENVGSSSAMREPWPEAL